MMSTDQRPLPATYAAAVFKGDDLDPELISAIMDRPPTLSYRRGDRYTVRGKDVERHFGLWVFSTRNIVRSASLKQHLAVLENLIIGTVSAWPDKTLGKIRDLVSTQDVQFRVDIFWYGAKGAELPKISRSFQYVVFEAGGTVETDFHRDGDETQAA